MATTVNEAFSIFMRDYVNLDPCIVKAARSSRDNLLSNISEFSNKDDFFNLCEKFNVHFGSFSRKTKIRPLDDIDFMVGISADGATYSSSLGWDKVTIWGNGTNESQIDCTNSDGTLNSTLVLNRFKTMLSDVREYKQSDIKRSGSAVVLTLKSREWNFDIVPCFRTVVETDRKNYYLIPNGKGGWMKTEPTIEKDRITNVNTMHVGKVLDTIRLVKFWNRRGQMPTMASYVIETMILDYFEGRDETPNYIDERFRDVLKYIANNIWNDIYDSKGIEGNINTLTVKEKKKLQERSNTDYTRICDAIYAETQEKDMRKAINIWRNILGHDFPTYG